MSTFLAYTSPAAGHLFPLMPGLLELRSRGHDVHVVTDPALVPIVGAAGLSASGLDARILDVHVADHELAGGRNGLRDALAQLMARGPYEREDLGRWIDELQPDAVLVDTLAYGGSVAAAASGRPWATTLPSLLPLPDRGIPPYGLGMRPRHDPIGRLRDRVVWRIVERAYAKAMLPPLNALRADAALAALASPFEQLLAADMLLVLTGSPLEYPRAQTPAKVRMVGAQTWDPPAEVPGWIDEPGDPWVLVTCSTDYQADEALARAALDGLADEPVRVLVTLADAHDTFTHPVPPNARLARFVPHAAVLERSVAVVCPGGMGITAKAIERGVPIVAVPFGRDQPEVARRITEARCGVALRPNQLSGAAVRQAVHQARAMAGTMPRVDRTAANAARFVEAVEELPRRAACAV